MAVDGEVVARPDDLLGESRVPVEERRPLGRRAAEALGPYVGVLVVLLALSVFFTITQPRFATAENLLTILETNASLIVVSVGLTFVMLVGGFDLSVGGMLVLTGVLLGKLTTGAGLPEPLTIPMIIVAAAAFGAVVNGGLIARLGLSFLVVTLGTMALTRGLALLISGGATEGLYEQDLIRWIGSGQLLGGVPVPAVLSVLVLAAAIYVTRSTGYGRLIYAVGGNPEASRLAGVNITLIRLSAYGISGALAGLAGVLEAGRLAAAAPDTAVGLELTAAAAVLLGGTALGGGSGTIIGTLLGALFLGVLNNGLIIASISVYWQGVVTGVVLILSVLVDRVRKVRRTAV